MQAILLHQIGDPDVLRMEDYPDPVPGPGDVVVRLRAAALNRRDLWIRRGFYPGIVFPIVLGSTAPARSSLSVPASIRPLPAAPW